MLLGKTLYINTKNNGMSGASVISERNHELVSLASSAVLNYSVELTLKNLRQNLRSIFIKFSLINETDIQHILEQIRTNNIETVFIDTSLLGAISKRIKTTFPNIYVIAFFHNVEYDYFRELIKVSKKIQHYFTLRLIKKAEFLLVNYSDVIITLNKRDSERLRVLYKRPADLILPTSFNDKYNENQYILNKNKGEVLNLLFVGSHFPPNVYAVDWFISNVLKHITRKVKLYIVGNGFEFHNFNENDERISMVGKVVDTSQYYYQSDLVIAPIFHGSGMKTKVAEALMYDKPIIGTKEAFEGYEIDNNYLGARCDTPKEYIDFIENFVPKGISVRHFFLANYSFDAVKKNFCNFLKNNGR